MEQKFFDNAVCRLMKCGALPDPITDDDVLVFRHLVEYEGCNVDFVFNLSGHNLELWKRNFSQIKIAITDSDNLYFTSEKVGHSPEKSDAVRHFTDKGGSEDFADKYEK